MEAGFHPSYEWCDAAAIMMLQKDDLKCPCFLVTWIPWDLTVQILRWVPPERIAVQSTLPPWDPEIGFDSTWIRCKAIISTSTFWRNMSCKWATYATCPAWRTLMLFWKDGGWDFRKKMQKRQPHDLVYKPRDSSPFVSGSKQDGRVLPATQLPRRVCIRYAEDDLVTGRGQNLPIYKPILDPISGRCRRWVLQLGTTFCRWSGAVGLVAIPTSPTGRTA